MSVPSCGPRMRPAHFCPYAAGGAASPSSEAYRPLRGPYRRSRSGMAGARNPTGTGRHAPLRGRGSCAFFSESAMSHRWSRFGRLPSSIGPVQPDPMGWEAELSWRASTLAPLFPVFAGTISARQALSIIPRVSSPPGGTSVLRGVPCSTWLPKVPRDGLPRRLDRVAAIGVA